MQFIANNIKQIAKNKGFTLKELAEKIGMTETGFYASIRNSSLKLEKLIRISEVLDTPLEALVSEGIDNYQSGVGNAGGNINDQTILQGKEQSVGAISDDKLVKLQHDLELCQSEKASLVKEVALKDEIIELLRGRKG